MDKPTSLFITHLRLLAALWLVMATAAVGLAQNGPIESGSGEFVPEIPASYSGSGSFFNRQLGTAFRFSYHNEGYGTQDGVVTLGTMKVFNQQGSTIFLDGQATLSDGFGGGFNAGIGYRTLANLGFGPDPRRINGISFWADGQSTSADNFFSQLGVAAESLGDSFDLRFQGNFPLERTKDGVRVDVPGAPPMFEGDALMGDLQRFARDTALTVIDLEGAKRIRDLEAWAFLGGYHLTGSGMDATGYRAGVRGYAVPDVSVSLQVTDDDIYHTNVVFGLTWFVGRTNRHNEPCGTLLDRFREPVLRNDYIATTQQIIDDPINPLSDAVSNEQFVFVHVDSDAPAGGDGTFENPYQTLAEAEAGSGDDNIVFVHSGSVFAGVDGQFATKDGQRVLGEGLDPNGIFIDHIVNSAEKGLVSLPESSPGSQGGDAPEITGLGTVFDLANHTSNEVNNFVINGGVTAVSANMAVSPQLANLDINNPTDDAIVFTDVTGNSLIENSVTIDGAGGKGILVDGGSGVLGANAMITNATGNAIEILNRTGGSMTVGEIEQILGGGGIYVHDNSGGTITFSGLANVTTTGAANSAVELQDNTGATITFQELQASSDASDTFVVNGGGTISVNDPTLADPNNLDAITNTGAGSALAVRGSAVSFTGDPSVTILGNISTSGTGQVVDIQEMAGGAVSITGDVTDNGGTGRGILVENNTAGTFSFAGATTLDTGVNSAVTSRNNAGPTVAVTFSSLDATAAAGDTFVVEGGGTISVLDPNSSIANTGVGTAVYVRGDVTFDGDPTVDISANVVNTVGGMSVDIQDMTGLGVVFSGLVNDTDGGVLIQNNTGGTFVFTDTLTVNTGNNNAVSLISNTGATLIFDGLDITSTGAGNKGFTATGGGDLTVPNTNPTTISSQTGTGLELDGMTIGPLGATFVRVDKASGAAEGILLKDLDGTGLVAIGSAADPNSGGTITSSTTGISVDNVASLEVNNVTINNSTGNGLNVTGQGAGSTATFSDLTVATTTGDGVTVENNTDGVVVFNNLSATATGTGNAVTHTDNTGATISYTELTATAADGHTFAVQGGGSITVNDTGAGSTISNTGTGNALFVQGDQADTDPPMADFDGNPTLTVSADIDNTFNGRVASIRRMTGGNITLNGPITDDQFGMLIEDNPGGTINVNGMVTLNTGANNALTIQANSSGSTVNFNAASQLDIDTTTGDGIRINGPGTVNILGSNNTVDTVGAGSGAAIRVTDAQAATINNTTVNVGAGSNTGDSDTVLVTHSSAAASSVTFNNLAIAYSGGVGMNVNINSTADSDLVVNNSSIIGVAQQGLLLDTGANITNVDFTLTNSQITVGNNSAVEAVLDEGVATIQFLIQNNTISNTSAGNAAMDIQLTTGSNLSATIGSTVTSVPADPVAPPAAPIGNNNLFRNTAGGGDPFQLVVNNALAVVNLDLRDNTAQGGTVEYVLTQTSGTFNLVDSADTISGANNVGTVNIGASTINNIAPPVAMPMP